MLKLEITGVSRAVTTQKGQTFTVQQAYVTLPGAKYPVEIELLPPKGAQPYPAGENYEYEPTFVVDEYKKLTIKGGVVRVVNLAPRKAA